MLGARENEGEFQILTRATGGFTGENSSLCPGCPRSETKKADVGFPPVSLADCLRGLVIFFMLKATSSLHLIQGH